MKTLTTYQVSRNFIWSFIFVLIWTLAPFVARADNFSSLAYEGVLTDSNGNYVNLNGINVTFSIVNGSSCVIFQEQHAAGDASGNVSHRIGTGTTQVFGGPLSSDHLTSSVSCQGGSTSIPSVGYSLKIEVNTPSFSATLPISAVPFAMAAADSEKLNGKSDSNFVNTTTDVTQTKADSLFGSYWTKLVGLLTNNLDGSGNYTGNVSGNAATATSATTAITAGNVTGTVAIANGGTGATTQSSAINGLLPSQSSNSGKVLTTDGSNISWSALNSLPTQIGNNGKALKTDGTSASWQTLATSDLSDFSTATDARITAQKAANNGLASLNFSGKVPSTQLSLTNSDIPSLDAGKITSGTFANAMLAGLGIEKLINATAKYFNYKPNNIACGNNEVLKYDSALDSGNGGWKCATDDSGSGSGTVSSGTVKQLAYYGATGSTVSGLSIGSANQILGMDMTGTGHEYKAITAGTGVSVSHAANSITISATGVSPTGPAGGDLSGTYPNPEVSKIKNQTITAAGSAPGQMLRYAGSNNWTPAFVGMQDLRSNVTGTPQLGTACGPSKTITYDSVLDTLSCSSIAITSTQVSGLGSLAAKSAVDLATSDVSGVLSIAKGGTNNGSLPVTAGGVIYTDGSKLMNAGSGTNGQVLMSSGSGAPTWSNISGGLPASTGSFASPGYAFTGDPDTGMFGDGNQIGFSTNGTEKVRINAAGNVGIGTSTPNQLLDVNGAAYIRGSLLLATGAITSDGFVNITAGGTNQDINLSPSGAGKVTTQGASLHVDGAMTSKTQSISGATFSFLETNIAYTTSSCGTFALHNLAEGGTYQLIIQGSTSNTCIFSAYSDGGTTSYSSTYFHMPPGHGPTIAGTHTLYSFLVAGGHVYVSWIPGY